MILSVSRRTDIPAYYAPWFFARMQAGYVLIRNPMSPRQVARVPLTPDMLDGIVFWTKNPAPMLKQLSQLGDIPYYFQYTLTSYGPEIEPNVPDKADKSIPTFQRLSDQIGPTRVLWRYDPILLSDTYTEDAHVRAFEAYAKCLQGYTERCTISFLDDYRATRRNATALAIHPCPPEAMHRLAKTLCDIARAYGMTMDACAENVDLTADGVQPARCVDAGLLAQIGGIPLRAAKDRNQRKACGCSASIDIGAYNTCPNGCLYCYANYDDQRIPRNTLAHDPASPLLIGQPGPDDRVYDRQVSSLRR